MKKPIFEKSRGALDRVRQLAENPNADQPKLPDAAQPRWAARLIASPHRVGSSSEGSLRQVDREVSDAGPVLNAVPDFSRFPKAEES